MNPMPPMGKRSSSQVSMLLPSTLTVKLSPEACVLTVIADRGFPGRRCGAITGDCATPATTAQRLNSSSPPPTAVSVQRRYSSTPAARTTQVMTARVDSREKIQIVVDQLQGGNEQGKRAGTHTGDVHQPVLHAAHPVVPTGSEVFFDADHGRRRGWSGRLRRDKFQLRILGARGYRRAGNGRGDRAFERDLRAANGLLGDKCGERYVLHGARNRRRQVDGKKVSPIACGESSGRRQHRHTSRSRLRGSPGDVRCALGRVCALCRTAVARRQGSGKYEPGGAASVGHLGQAHAPLGDSYFQVAAGGVGIVPFGRDAVWSARPHERGVGRRLARKGAPVHRRYAEADPNRNSQRITFVSGRIDFAQAG